MGMSYSQAKSLGLDRLWPNRGGNTIPAIQRPVVSKAPDDGLNKLERSFWERLQQAQHDGVFDAVHVHAIKVQVIGDCRWYIPDFMAFTQHGHVRIYETKGRMREDAELKLIAAAAKYPQWDWVLVRRVKRRWDCQTVTAAGIGREAWRPDWLT